MNVYELSADPNDDQAIAVTMSKREFQLIANVLWNIQWGYSEIGNALRSFGMACGETVYNCTELSLWAETTEKFPVISDDAALPD